MSMQPTDWPRLSALLQSFCLHQGIVPVAVVIKTTTGELQLPIVAAPAPRKKKRFVPTPIQNAILEALDGKAMRTNALAAALGGEKMRRAIFRRPGGIAELIEHGLVEHHARAGYFRPDAPPEELKED